jgi:ABC-2 type transport system permease protein
VTPGAREPGRLDALGDAWTLFRREMIRYRRDRAYWVGQIAFPIVFVGFIGFGLEQGMMPTGTDYVRHLATGVLVMLVGSGAVGGGFALIQDRDTGFLRALLVAPVARASIVAAKLAARLAVSVALVALLVGLLALVRPVRLPHPGAALLAVCGVTAVFAALGVALASRLRRLESFRLLAALVTVPLYLLSGIFYPLAGLAPPLRALAYANPLAHGVDLFRFGVLGASEIPPLLSGALLCALTAGAAALAVAAFERGTRE